MIYFIGLYTPGEGLVSLFSFFFIYFLQMLLEVLFPSYPEFFVVVLFWCLYGVAELLRE